MPITDHQARITLDVIITADPSERAAAMAALRAVLIEDRAVSALLGRQVRAMDANAAFRITDAEWAGRFAAGSNMPGYLPEGDEAPGTFLSFEEAKAALIYDMLSMADETEDEDEAESLTHAAEAVNLWNGPDTVEAAGLAWWVMDVDE